MASKLFSSFNQLSDGQLQVTNRFLGSGSYASVHTVYVSGVKCAAKKLHNFFFQYSDERNQQNDSKHAIVRFSEECRILSQISYHPNIIQFRGIYWESSNAPAPLLVMEYLPTNIDSLIEKCGKIPHEISYLLLHGIACGLEVLHNRTAPVIHRDLTAKNVLISTDLRAKIADFGMATGHIRPNNMTQAPGNFVYMPPESMSANPSYDTSVDIFSFGVLAIYMLSGTLPIPRESAVQSDKSGGLRAVHEFFRRWDYLEMIGFTHPSINLIFQCIDNDPSRRASAAAIVSQVNDIVAKHPAPANYKERWKLIIERLERNEDIAELIALQDVHQDSGQISNGATFVGSARQEDNREQKMNISEMESSCMIRTGPFSELIERCVHNETNQMSGIIAASTECSLSLTLSGALFSEVHSQRSLKWEIAHYISCYCQYLTPGTSYKTADKTNTMNSITLSSPTTNCFLNMESHFPIVRYGALKSDRFQEAKVTDHLLDIHTPSVTNVQQAIECPVLSLAQSGFTFSHGVSKQMMLLLGSVGHNKGDLCITFSCAALITTLVSILQTLLEYINSLLAGIDKLEVIQAHVQLSALVAYLSTSLSNLQAIWTIENHIETAVASIQFVNTEQYTSIHYEKACSLFEGHLLYKYGYQISLIFTAQIGISILDTPALTFVVVSAPGSVVCPATMGKLGMMKTHSRQFTGVVKEGLSFDPSVTPLREGTYSLSHASVYCINSNYLYMSFQTAIHLTNDRLSSLHNYYINVRCVEIRFNPQQYAKVSHLIRQQLMDKAKTNAKINSQDHMSQLPIDKANQHPNVENSCLAFVMKFSRNISSLTYGKPDKVSGIAPNSTEVIFPDKPNLIMDINWAGSEKPPESDKTNQNNHVPTSPPLKFHFQSTSHKSDVASCLTLNTCTAAEVIKTMITLLANLPFSRLELVMKLNAVQPTERVSQAFYCREVQLIVASQSTLSISAIKRTDEAGSDSSTVETSCESSVYLQPYQRNKEQSTNNSEVVYQEEVMYMDKRVSFSYLTGGTDKQQDAIGNITLNIDSVLFSLSIHASAVTFGFRLFLSQVMLHPFQTMQRFLTTTHLISRLTVNKTWTTLLPFDTYMRTCNKTSPSIQSYTYTAMENIEHKSGKQNRTLKINTTIPTSFSLNMFMWVTNKIRKKSKNVGLSQNIIDLEQGTRVRTNIRLNKLLSNEICHSMVVEQLLDIIIIHVLTDIDVYDCRPDNLFQYASHVLQKFRQHEASEIVGNDLNHQRSVNFCENNTVRGMVALHVEATS